MKNNFQYFSCSNPYFIHLITPNNRKRGVGRDTGGEQEELADVGEAGGDMGIVGKSVEVRRKAGFSNAVSAKDPFGS